MKIIQKFLLMLLVLPFLAIPVYAHCPLCTAATGAVVATARFYGVDDMITGTFIGGFLVSTGLWIHNVLKKRNKGRNYIPFQAPALIIVSVVSTIAALYVGNMIVGADRLFVGILTGSIITVTAFWFHNGIRIVHSNRNYVPMQGIVLPLLFLVVLNICLHLLGVV